MLYMLCYLCHLCCVMIFMYAFYVMLFMLCSVILCYARLALVGLDFLVSCFIVVNNPGASDEIGLVQLLNHACNQ